MRNRVETKKQKCERFLTLPVAGIHYTKLYDWRWQFAAMVKEAFLAYQVSKQSRGIKQMGK